MEKTFANTYDHVDQTIPDELEEIEIDLKIMSKTNYEWKKSCTEKGLTHRKLAKILEATQNISTSAGIIMIVTFFQLLIC